jgi:hypothetical protein
MIECFPPRARSSMVEQWPFKPLVESSSLSALMKDLSALSISRGAFLIPLTSFFPDQSYKSCKEKWERA